MREVLLDEKYLPTILIVDDTPANLELLAGMLKKPGYRVRVAPSGPLALKIMHGSRPDLVLLDISMPGMDGYEVCRIMKNNPDLAGIPIIFISALQETADKVRAFQSGGVDYISKPFQFAEVEARVATHLELYRYRQSLENMVEEKVREINDSQIAAIYALAKLAESRDDKTGFHLERVTGLCKIIAEKLRQSQDYGGAIDSAFIKNIYYASVLHDIGKVGIPDQILLKPARLNAAEFAVMKTHTLIGAATLAQAQAHYPKNEFLNMGVVIARSHHEKWDGSGYPDGLAKAKIPLAARIMAIADVYDALRSQRPYKEAVDREQSRQQILDGRGTQFDPDIVDAFIQVETDWQSVYGHKPHGEEQSAAGNEGFTVCWKNSN